MSSFRAASGNLTGMKLSYDKLSDAELVEALRGIPEWTIESGMLSRLFEFKAYKDGLVFASAVGWEADRLNHHPDIQIGYGKVRVVTVTHDAGGLTSYDIELARLVDSLA